MENKKNITATINDTLTGDYLKITATYEAIIELLKKQKNKFENQNLEATKDNSKRSIHKNSRNVKRK